MIVVSDTSPILNLWRIDRLALLGRLYGDVLIPPAVLVELKRAGNDALTDAVAAVAAVVAPVDRDLVQRLATELDAGEAEAIVLARERSADLLLVDERRGRKVAAAMGLQVTGLLGILVHAKRVGLVTDVKPILDDLINRARFWIGRDLYDMVLAELGEKEGGAVSE